MLTQKILKEFLHYDRLTGIFKWKVRAANCIHIGDVAGKFALGYTSIQICGKSYQAHRLAWLYVKGVWPLGEIDHKNSIGCDNRFDNLRDVTTIVNQQNRVRARKDSRTGFMGVTPFRKRFRAQINVDGKCVRLGTHDSPELAHAAYLEAKRRLHTGCMI